jgi:hypothetical protein
MVDAGDPAGLDLKHGKMRLGHTMSSGSSGNSVALPEPSLRSIELLIRRIVESKPADRREEGKGVQTSTLF